MRSDRRSRLALLLAGAALAVAIGGTGIAAIAAIPQDGRFTACYQTSSSVLDRVVLFAEPNEACPSTYARVTWSQAGATGPQGPAGPPGPQGPTGASRGSTPIVSVVERRVTLTSDRDAVARCPKSTRAVGGGGRIHSTTRHEPLHSHPLVEKRAPVGWAYRPRERRGFAFKAVEGGLVETFAAGFPNHRHKVTFPPLLYPVEPSGFARSPADVTVYAICLGSLQVGGPLPRP